MLTWLANNNLSICPAANQRELAHNLIEITWKSPHQGAFVPLNTMLLIVMFSLGRGCPNSDTRQTMNATLLVLKKGS